MSSENSGQPVRQIDESDPEQRVGVIDAGDPQLDEVTKVIADHPEFLDIAKRDPRRRSSRAS